ncbi:MAG: hypothetical protein ACRDMX_11155, partial [Solirubrobacteraceae bacterium]
MSTAPAPTARRVSGRGSVAVFAGAVGSTVAAGLCLGLASLLIGPSAPASDCPSPSPASRVVVSDAAPGGARVGATEYGGPGDPSSGTVGASGVNLVAHPDSYAELGGLSFQSADALGGLPYMTPLRITWGNRSAIAYKRDFGFGGGPIAGLSRAIDLWWRFAGALGIPYEDGRWSGAVRVSAEPATGAGDLLGQAVGAVASAAVVPAAAVPATAAAGVPASAVPATAAAGDRACDDAASPTGVALVAG